MGIGNEYRNDDGIGIYIVKKFQDPDWLVLNCAMAPENFSSVIKKHNPEYLVLIDAAQMDLPPGSIRRIPVDQIQQVGMGTHSLPLYFLVEYLRPAVKKDIFLIGIQKKVIDDGTDISPELVEGANKLMHSLERKTFEQIEIYCPHKIQT